MSRINVGFSSASLRSSVIEFQWHSAKA